MARKSSQFACSNCDYRTGNWLGRCPECEAWGTLDPSTPSVRAGSQAQHSPEAVPYPEIPAFYRDATLFLSASRTGSVDKVVLEAMAAGRPVVTCSEAFAPILAELGDDAERLLYRPGDAEDLARKIEALLAASPAERDALGARLRAIVARDHEVGALAERLVREMEGVAGARPRLGR